MPDLTTLRDSVRAAEGADRELDALIHLAVCDDDRPPASGRAALKTGVVAMMCGDQFRREFAVAKYTASIDAALWLVEAKLRPAHPLMTVKLDGRFSNSHGDFWFAEITWPSQERQGRGRTAALSLLSALLTALSEGGDDG